ncbi:MAG: hypothetical protein KJO26_00460 [Deltaproteobacteria bacterium]|nr:hypothetical protein [Deltaproteobacteria bacterium]
MEIIINDMDLKKLSPHARDEIINLITSSKPDDASEAGAELKHGKKITPIPRINAKDDQEIGPAFHSDEPYDLTPKMAKMFLSGCSKRTKEFLTVFINNDGIGYVDSLIKGIKDRKYKTKRDLNGVLAGITRRIRKLGKNPNTHLLKWEYDVDNKNKRGGYWRISNTTYKSLKKYINA